MGQAYGIQWKCVKLEPSGKWYIDLTLEQPGAEACSLSTVKVH